MRVAVEREGQVGPVRGVGRLIGKQLVLDGEGQGAQLLERSDTRAAEALALERVGLADELDQAVKRGQLR
jgi:hypothetical protein